MRPWVIDHGFNGSFNSRHESEVQQGMGRCFEDEVGPWVDDGVGFQDYKVCKHIRIGRGREGG